MSPLILDRIEAGLAHLETADGRTIVLPGEWLPPGTREGDVLTASSQDMDAQTRVILERDLTATHRRREELKELREGLTRGPEGDLDL